MHEAAERVKLNLADRIYFSTLNIFSEHVKTLGKDLSEIEIIQMLTEQSIPIKHQDYSKFAAHCLKKIEDSKTWPAIKSSREESVCPWDASLFPDIIGLRAEQIALTQGIEPGAFALAALCACSGAVDHRFSVRVLENNNEWIEHPRIWFLLIASSSYSKTSIISKACSPLKKIEHALSIANQKIREQYLNEKAAWEKEKNKSKDEPPKPPKYPRAMADDATIEALSEIIKDNPQGILVEKDEMGSFFAALDKVSGGTQNPQKRDWIQGYDGKPRSIDRIQRGSIYCENWSFSILGATQYDSMRRNFKTMPEDGMIARFIPFCAGSQQLGEDTAIDTRVEKAYDALVKILHGFKGAAFEPFRFTAKGYFLLKRAQVELFKLRNNHATESNAIAHLGKMSGLIPRLCCLYHLIGAASNERIPAREISDDVVEQVIRLVQRMIIPHVMRMYASCVESKKVAGVEKVIEFINKYVNEYGVYCIEQKVLIQSCRAFKDSSPQDRENIKAELVERNIIRVTGGKWSIHPFLLSDWE